MKPNLYRDEAAAALVELDVMREKIDALVSENASLEAELTELRAELARRPEASDPNSSTGEGERAPKATRFRPPFSSGEYLVFPKLVG